MCEREIRIVAFRCISSFYNLLLTSSQCSTLTRTTLHSDLVSLYCFLFLPPLRLTPARSASAKTRSRLPIPHTKTRNTSPPLAHSVTSHGHCTTLHHSIFPYSQTHRLGTSCTDSTRHFRVVVLVAYQALPNDGLLSARLAAQDGRRHGLSKFQPSVFDEEPTIHTDQGWGRERGARQLERRRRSDVG